MDSFGETPFRFPELPILNQAQAPAPPARSQREKYGGLFYLGIGGLVVLVALIAWFAQGVWSNRDVWADVYTLHDRDRPESERLDAARRLSQSPRFNDSQKMETSLRRDLPDLARYLLAEAVSTDAVARDPRGYAMAVARSSGWPDWLRLLLARRLAYGAALGYDIPRDPVVELSESPDPMIAAWANYTLAVAPGSDASRTARLEEMSKTPGATGELVGLLLAALHAPPEERDRRLDEATAWLQAHHPQAKEIWKGWEIRDQRLVRAELR